MTETGKGEAERRVGSSNVSSSCGEKLELACTFITALIALHGLSHECSLQQVAGFKTSTHTHTNIYVTSYYPCRPSALTCDFLTQNDVFLLNFLTSLHLNSKTTAFHILFRCYAHLVSFMNNEMETKVRVSCYCLTANTTTTIS
jgi:hypothetical protein